MVLSEALGTLILERQEMAYKRAKKNPFYNEIRKNQLDNMEKVEKILKRLKKDERLTVRRYYEREVEISSIEVDEIYIQGFRDAFGLLMLLGVSV
ncbi:MAG: hypothetical protein FWE74_04125 [Oscillospiraceae bacterium]|nr:hypothetical protein [Oscillospiraceae bacterium]